MTAAADAAMPAELSAPERAALADDIRLLIRLSDREIDADLVTRLRAVAPADWFGLQLEHMEGEAIGGMIARGLADLSDPPTQDELDDLAAEFAAIYLSYSYHAAPTESVWRNEENLERQEAMFLVRSWYAHHGVRVPDWRIRSDDHLVNELQFLALLIETAPGREGLAEAARFLRDHLLVWVPDFGRRVAQRCRKEFYAGCCLLTGAYLRRLAAFLGDLSGLDMTPPELLLHGEAAPAVPSCGDARKPVAAKPATPRPAAQELRKLNAQVTR